MSGYVDVDESTTYAPNVLGIEGPLGMITFSLIQGERDVFLSEGSKTVPDSGEIILGDDFTSKYSLGDSFELAGKQFEIISISHNFGEIIMTLEDFENLNIPINYVRFVPYDELSATQLETLRMQMSEVFPNNQYVENTFESELQFNTIRDFTVIGAIYLMAIFSFVFLVKALIDKNKKENIIYSIHGLSRRRLFSLVIIETVLLNFINLCIACVIHSMLYDIFFIHVTQGVARHHLSDYITIVLFAMAISLGCLIPVFYRYNKQSLMKQKSKG